jgi:hypothetical protein
MTIEDGDGVPTSYAQQLILNSYVSNYHNRGLQDFPEIMQLFTLTG